MRVCAATTRWVARDGPEVRTKRANRRGLRSELGCDAGSVEASLGDAVS